MANHDCYKCLHQDIQWMVTEVNLMLYLIEQIDLLMICQARQIRVKVLHVNVNFVFYGSADIFVKLIFIFLLRIVLFVDLLQFFIHGQLHPAVLRLKLIQRMILLHQGLSDQEVYLVAQAGDVRQTSCESFRFVINNL